MSFGANSDNGPSMPLVAVDDGYAQIKLWGENPEGGAPIRLLLKSSARAGRSGLVDLQGRRGIGSYRTVPEGEEFTVSPDLAGESTQFDGFHTSTLNRVLVHHALMVAGFGGRQIRLVAGLPVADYFFDGGRDEEKIAAKTDNLMKSVVCLSGNHSDVRVSQVRIGCQAIAAFGDYVIDDALKDRDVPTGQVAVVDVGGRTTDIAVILDGARLDEARSGTQNIGVLDVYASLAKQIRAQFKTRDSFSTLQLDQALREGKIKLWGRQENIAHLVEDTVKEQEVQIAREVERRIGRASSIDAVLFVGGGSCLFKTLADRFPNGVTVKDPEFANARGLYKYAKKFGV